MYIGPCIIVIVEEQETILMSLVIEFYFTCFSLLHGYHPNPATPKLQHTSKQEHTTNVVITIEKSQAPDDGCIKVRNMLIIEEVK